MAMAFFISDNYLVEDKLFNEKVNTVDVYP